MVFSVFGFRVFGLGLVFGISDVEVGVFYIFWIPFGCELRYMSRLTFQNKKTQFWVESAKPALGWQLDQKHFEFSVGIPPIRCSVSAVETGVFDILVISFGCDLVNGSSTTFEILTVRFWSENSFGFRFTPIALLKNRKHVFGVLFLL